MTKRLWKPAEDHDLDRNYKHDQPQSPDQPRGYHHEDEMENAPRGTPPVEEEPVRRARDAD